MVKINYQKITLFDTANGPGIRSTLWVSGCNHQCKGCQNPETWDKDSGNLFTNDTMDQILDSLRYPYIRGLTISGGDPLYPSNRGTVTDIAKKVKEIYPDKDIWVWTGYLYKEVCHLDIMNYIDVIVDGPFILEQRDITLPYSGSPNQKVINVKESLSSGRIILYT